MRSEDPLGDGLRAGTTLVGSPDTVADGIERLLAHTGQDGPDEHGNYGCGGVLFRAHEWANREDTLRSYELFARWVMPRFQGSTITTRASREWCSENRTGVVGPSTEALKKAFIDAGKEVPDHMRMRLHTGKVEL
jgi:limonene 1,2-monooxygenase